MTSPAQACECSLTFSFKTFFPLDPNRHKARHQSHTASSYCLIFFPFYNKFGSLSSRPSVEMAFLDSFLRLIPARMAATCHPTSKLKVTADCQTMSSSTQHIVSNTRINNISIVMRTSESYILSFTINQLTSYLTNYLSTLLANYQTT